MAGSWRHITTDDGKLLCNEDAVQMLENGGDWYEFAEEVYGMTWWLASKLAEYSSLADASDLIEKARKEYKQGIALSPGTDGELKEEN